MIWWLDNTTLMKEYINEPLATIERANYLTLSSRVINTKAHPNVLNMYQTFMSLNQLKGVDILTDIHSSKARDEFKSYLLKHHKIILFLVEVLATEVESGDDTLFIVHDSEATGNIDVFVDVFADLFKYKINKYPTYSRPLTSDLNAVIRHYRDEVDDTMLKYNSDASIYKILKSMDKTELRAMMTRQHLEYDGLSKNEMVEEIMRCRSSI